jgi:site-specific DNA recombinase
MRVALYVRVSTERQQQAQTIEQQITSLRAYLAEHPDWDLRAEHVFRDDGRSGAKLERPGLDALRDQAARAAFDAVLMTAPDRLARNYVHQMIVLEELERQGVAVLFLDRPPSDDPHEQLVTQIRGAVAEYERVLIADRMRRGRQAKLRAGRLLPWTRAPYGYCLHPEHPRDPAWVQVDPVTAAVVQDVFARYAAGGVTLHALAVHLTRQQVPSPTGKPLWTASTLRGMLTNPAYQGQAASGRLRSRPAARRRSPLEPVGRGMSTQPCPPDQWITVPVPALVSAETFVAVQQRLRSNQQLAKRNAQHTYLLRGLVSCGVCRLSCTGRALHAATSYQYYVCRGKLSAVSSDRLTRCASRLTPATQLDALVWADLCQVLQHPELVRETLMRAQAGAWVPEEVQRRQASLRAVRAGLVRQQARLLEAYLAEVVDLPTFEAKRQELLHQESDVQARERELAAQTQRAQDVATLAASTSEVLQRLALGLENATADQQRELVERLIDRVVVTNGDVEIRYVIPTTEASTPTRFCQLRTDYFDAHAAAIEGLHLLGVSQVGDQQPRRVAIAAPEGEQVHGDHPILARAHVGEPAPLAALERHRAQQALVTRVLHVHVRRHPQHERGVLARQPADQVRPPQGPVADDDRRPLHGDPLQQLGEECLLEAILTRLRLVPQIPPIRAPVNRPGTAPLRHGRYQHGVRIPVGSIHQDRQPHPWAHPASLQRQIGQPAPERPQVQAGVRQQAPQALLPHGMGERARVGAGQLREAERAAGEQRRGQQRQVGPLGDAPGRDPITQERA